MILQFVDHEDRGLLVELPLVVKNESNLRGGSRSSWALSKSTKAQKEAVAWALRAPLRTSALLDRDGVLALPVVVVLSRLAQRSYDTDGTVTSLKHVRDAVAECLGLRSDRDPRVAWAYGHDRALLRGGAKVPGVRIEIHPRRDQAA